MSFHDDDFDLWILDGRVPKGVGLEEWGVWMDNPNARRIAKDYLSSERYGHICVSTIFMGIPIMGDFFETMIFRERGTDDYNMPPPDDLTCAGFWGEMRRYQNYGRAEIGHQEIVDELIAMGRWTEVDSG